MNLRSVGSFLVLNVTAIKISKHSDIDLKVSVYKLRNLVNLFCIYCAQNLSAKRIGKDVAKRAKLELLQMQDLLLHKMEKRLLFGLLHLRVPEV